MGSDWRLWALPCPGGQRSRVDGSRIPPSLLNIGLGGTAQPLPWAQPQKAIYPRSPSNQEQSWGQDPGFQASALVWGDYLGRGEWPGSPLTLGKLPLCLRRSFSLSVRWRELTGQLRRNTNSWNLVDHFRNDKALLQPHPAHTLVSQSHNSATYQLFP